MFIHADYITDIEERNNVDNWFVVLTMLVSILLHIIGECKFNCGLNTFINCNSTRKLSLGLSKLDLLNVSKPLKDVKETLRLGFTLMFAI